MLSINKIYQGDCLEIMKSIDDKSIDMILCDLPYGVTACKWDCVIPIKQLWKEYNRICKGVVCLFSTQPFSTYLIDSNMKNYKYSWYWIKNQGTNFFHAKQMPIRKVEEILVFNKSVYNPQFKTNCIPTRKATNCSNGNIYYGINKRNYEGGNTTRYPDNVLNFKCVNNYHRLHPTQKPIELCEYLIKTYSNEGDLILDNCCGSGTTCLAAKNTGRNFIGIEKEQEYVEIAEKRLTE